MNNNNNKGLPLIGPWNNIIRLLYWFVFNILVYNIGITGTYRILHYYRNSWRVIDIGTRHYRLDVFSMIRSLFTLQ